MHTNQKEEKQEMRNYPKVLAIILNYKTYEMTLDIIDKLQNLNYPELDVLVVVNNSPNESADKLRKATEK